MTSSTESSVSSPDSSSESDMTTTSRKISSSWSRPLSSSPRHLTSVSRHKASTTLRAFCHVVSLSKVSYLVWVWRIWASTASCTRRARVMSAESPTFSVLDDVPYDHKHSYLDMLGGRGHKPV